MKNRNSIAIWVLTLYIGVLLIWTCTPIFAVTLNKAVTKHHVEVMVTPNLDLIDPPNIIVYINGMVCSFCAQGLKNTFKNHKAIKVVSISLEHKSIGLHVKKFGKITDKMIRTMVSNAGYEVKSITRK